MHEWISYDALFLICPFCSCVATRKSVDADTDGGASHPRIDRWICLLIVWKVIGGQCDNAITYSEFRREEWKPRDDYKKNEIISADYVALVRRSRARINARRICVASRVAIRGRVGFAHIHRVPASRISLMQMRTIPTVMSGITFKFIGSRRYDREKKATPAYILFTFTKAKALYIIYRHFVWYFRRVT